MKKKLLQKARSIKLVILDADGVLTDGSIQYGANGNRVFEVKAFSAQDGLGISRAIKFGIPVAVISGRRSRILQWRTKELGIRYLFQGEEGKLSAFKRLKRQFQLKDEEIACMGDDLPDLVLLNRVGLSAAPNGAVPKVQLSVDYVSSLSGGHGAVREFIDLILRAQKKIK